MLEENRAELEKAGVLWWHERGYKGKGTKIAVLDIGGLEELQKGYAINPLNEGEEAKHGANCCGVIHEVAPEAEIILLPNNETSVDYILEHNIKLVSVSMAGPDMSYYAKLKGKASVFCAAGNEGRDEIRTYPAAYDWTISVGAYFDDTESMATYSNAGEELDISSYTSIYLPHDAGHIFPFGGTSCATPFARPMSGLWVGACREIGYEPSIDEIDNYARDNCRDILEAGHDNKSGWGVFTLPKRIPTKITLTMNSDKALIGDKEFKLKAPMKVISGRSYIPLGDFEPLFGLPTSWDNTKKQATIILK